MSIKTFRGLKAFRSWQHKSSVRARHHDYDLTADDLSAPSPEHWFPTTLSAALVLPEIKCLPTAKRLKAHVAHLVHFLDYTTDLEMTLVNRAVSLMVHGRISRYFDVAERQAVLMLYTDESFHAFVSRQMSDQVSLHFGISRKKSSRCIRIQRYLNRCPEKYREFAVFVVAFISETIITKELLIGTQGRLIAPVHSILQDHLLDEARHSLFFMDCFVKLIPQLDGCEKKFVTKALADLLRIFFRPDQMLLHSILGGDLQAYAHAVHQLECSAFERGRVTASSTLHTIQETKLLNEHCNALIFRELGLVP